MEQDKLVSGHFRVTEYGIDLELLKFLIRMGVKVTKVHAVVSFLQQKVFKEYIDHCIEQRNKYRNQPAASNLFKQLSNTVYGRSILDCLKYGTQSTLVTAANVGKHMSDPKF